jgi:hypothetical protein
MKEVLDRLERFPLLLRSIFSPLDIKSLRVAPRQGGFSLLEHAWHLADLETEGYTVRIVRLLHETEPVLRDFDGDAVARERHYNDLGLESALRRFTAARLVNVRRMRAATPHDWERSGMQEGAGHVTLTRVLNMMLDHDISHSREIAALLRQIEVAVPRELELTA